MVELLVIALTCVIILLCIISRKKMNAKCSSTKRLVERVVVITGGTTGMGLEAAKDFARRNAKVIIACPFIEEGVNAREEIVAETRNDKVLFKLLDLASLTSVRQFAEEILKTESRLDILMNNAGVGVPLNSKSYNGTNFIMHVNYFGHFLLTILLLPLLKKSATSSEPSRIVNISSFLHAYGNTDYKWCDKTHIWYRLSCYCNSKFCLVLFGHELSKKLKDSNVVVNAVDPGLVSTKIYDSASKLIGGIIKILLYLFFYNTLEGVQTALHVSLDDEAGESTGQFYKHCKRSKAQSSAYNDILSKQLWDDSIKLVKLKEDEVKQCLGDKK